MWNKGEKERQKIEKWDLEERTGTEGGGTANQNQLGRQDMEEGKGKGDKICTVDTRKGRTTLGSSTAQRHVVTEAVYDSTRSGEAAEQDPSRE